MPPDPSPRCVCSHEWSDHQTWCYSSGCNCRFTPANEPDPVRAAASMAETLARYDDLIADLRAFNARSTHIHDGEWCVRCVEHGVVEEVQRNRRLSEPDPVRAAAAWLVKVHADDATICGTDLWEDLQALRAALALDA